MDTFTPAMVATSTSQQLARLRRRERRLARYQQVIELYQQGHSVNAISRMVQLERKTIRRWIRTGQFPERKRPIQPRPKGSRLSWSISNANADQCRTSGGNRAIPM